MRAKFRCRVGVGAIAHTVCFSIKTITPMESPVKPQKPTCVVCVCVCVCVCGVVGVCVCGVCVCVCVWIFSMTFTWANHWRIYGGWVLLTPIQPKLINVWGNISASHDGFGEVIIRSLKALSQNLESTVVEDLTRMTFCIFVFCNFLVIYILFYY